MFIDPAERMLGVHLGLQHFDPSGFQCIHPSIYPPLRLSPYPFIQLALSFLFPSGLCLAVRSTKWLLTAPVTRGQVRAGVLDSLASAGDSTEAEVQREVAAGLCNLSLEEEVRLSVAQTCMPAIVALAQGGDLEAARQSVGALANLAEDVETHK